jgi:tetratricopeptide (TPR) repeat protein
MLALWPLDLPVERINYRAEMRYLAAGAHQRQGDLEATRLALESALREQPDHLEAAVNLGLLHAQQGRPDEARRWLTQALQHHPGDPVARQALRSLER